MSMFSPSTVDGAVGVLGKALADLQAVVERHMRERDIHLTETRRLDGEIERGTRITSKLAELLW